jgi:hypothetical protein
VAGVLATIFFGVSAMKYRKKSRNLGQAPTIGGYAYYVSHVGDIHNQIGPDVVGLTGLNIYQVSVRRNLTSYFSAKILNHRLLSSKSVSTYYLFEIIILLLEFALLNICPSSKNSHSPSCFDEMREIFLGVNTCEAHNKLTNPKLRMR